MLAIVLAWWVMPRFGAAGGYTGVAIAALLGVIPALMTPHRFADLPAAQRAGGAPPLRGWLALIATLIFVASSGAVGVYLQPLAHEAGLSADVARTSNWLSLGAQVAGASVATALAGRVRYFTVFVASTAGMLVIWWLFGRTIPAWLFIAANTAGGFVSIFLAPFLVPFTIEADPSRRAALQSGAAQLLGGALGPWMASAVVGEAEVRGVLLLGAGLILTGLAGVAGLRFTRLAPAGASA